jgi:malate/lactate dehydrogenase
MEKFLNLTHANGRALVNIRHMVGVVEQDGTVYVIGRHAGDPMVVLETYDEIMEMIDNFNNF